MWPGSNFPYDNNDCTHKKVFDQTVSFYDRVDIAIKWIKDDKKPANLIMFYIEEPDNFAHPYGVTSTKVTDFVAQLNNVTKYLHEQLVKNNLINRTSVIHLSDHGMSDLQPPNIIDLREFVGNDSCMFYGTTPILQIVPKKGKLITNHLFQNITMFRF
jgi:ectonucleotide pyrophosphatase/phosphodiesterase family protein 5